MNELDLGFQEFVRDAASGLLRRRMGDVGLAVWKKIAIQRELARRERVFGHDALGSSD